MTPASGLRIDTGAPRVIAGVPIAPGVLRADDVAAVLRRPRRKVIDQARAGAIPAPLNPDEHPRCWQWAPSHIAAYVAGTWRPYPVLLPMHPIHQETTP